MSHRLEELALFFAQGQQPLCTLEELIALSFGPYSRWGRKRAYQHLLQLFDINAPTHRRALLSYFANQPQKRVHRPPWMPESITEQMLQPELLRFLAESAPPQLQEWLLLSKERARILERQLPLYPNLPGQNRQTERALLLAYLTPLYPDLVALEASQRWMLDIIQSRIRAQRHLPPDTERSSLLEMLTSPIRSVRQASYHCLWRRGTPSLLALKETMQEQPIYQPGEFPRGIMAPEDPKRFFSQEERHQGLVGTLVGRLMFRDASREQTRMSTLREILTFPANHATWHTLCVFLNNWCQHKEFQPDIVYPYVNDHLQSWSDDLRLAPRSWWESRLRPPRRPWPIIRRIELGDIPLFGSQYAKQLAPYHQAYIQKLWPPSESISHCTQFFVQGCRMGDQAWQMMLEQLPIDTLQVLNLDRNGLSSSTLQKTVASPRLQSLRCLSFRFNKSTSDSDSELIANIRKKNAHIEHILL